MLPERGAHPGKVFDDVISQRQDGEIAEETPRTGKGDVRIRGAEGAFKLRQRR